MKCPYLKEARVKYCEKSAIRKMIRVPGNVAQETCSSRRYRECVVYQRDADDCDAAQCPYLRESLTRYCATASVTRFIPYSESLLSRCANDAYRFCDVYLGMAHAQAPESDGKRDLEVAGMQVPNWLYYAANHMWLDTSKDGSCHVGLDAFLSRVLGAAERITFLTAPGIVRPAAVVTVRGMDLEVVFPNAMLQIASNLHLRANPAKLTADPYGAGWLFQSVQLPGQPPITSGLVRGDDIQPWMEREVGRMSDFLGRCRISRHENVMNDGGVFSADLLQQLDRDEALRLFHEFFSGVRA